MTEFFLEWECEAGEWLPSTVFGHKFKSRAAAESEMAKAQSTFRRLRYRIVSRSTSDDPINQPEHYTDGGIDTRDFINAKQLNYNVGNAVKYLSRAGKKTGVDYVQDIEKAKSFLEYELSRIKEKNGGTK